ncbi:hypothetical protein T484DRAFT_1977323 [Baffinella frigidus]|nr:hypothetical protein T484DRAFT_1977323 [Cryptophyta sp. CCMP2293]
MNPEPAAHAKRLFTCLQHANTFSIYTPHRVTLPPRCEKPRWSERAVKVTGEEAAQRDWLVVRGADRLRTSAFADEFKGNWSR